MDDTRIKALTALAYHLRSCHLQTYDEVMLDDCIAFATEAIAGTCPFEPAVGSSKGKYHIIAKITLAKAMRSRFQLKSDINDLDNAIEIVEECMNLQSRTSLLTSDNCGDLVNQIALMLRSRYDEHGDLEDLETAIQHIQNFLNGRTLFPSIEGIDPELRNFSFPYVV